LHNDFDRWIYDAIPENPDKYRVYGTLMVLFGLNNSLSKRVKALKSCYLQMVFDGLLDKPHILDGDGGGGL